MDGVTVKEYGLSFVWECFKNYLGGSWPLAAFFAAGIALSLIMYFSSRNKAAQPGIVTPGPGDGKTGYSSGDPLLRRNDIQPTWLFLSICFMCAVTVCNPFLVRALIPKLGMTTVYYRFFWVLPVTLGASYYLVQALWRLRRRLVRALAFVIIAGAAAFTLPADPALSSFRFPDNLYKVNGAIPVLCDAIHEDFENSVDYQEADEKLRAVTDKTTEEWLEAVQDTYPVCVFPYQLEFAVRQYDPTVRLLFNRNQRLYYEGNRSTGITYGSNNKAYRRKARILDALYGEDDTITERQFRRAMNKTGTQYLIAEENLANESFMTQCGCTQIGIVAGYRIFRYDG